MLHSLPRAADRTAARKNAVHLGALLGARVVSRRQVSLEEPDCPYEVRWNVEPFWFGVRVSDASFVVQGNHKGRFESAIAFWASLKTSDQAMRTCVPLEPLSSEMGVSVFVAESRQGKAVAAALRSAECKSILSRIHFGSIRSLFLSPVQLYCVSSLQIPADWARQVTLLRELLLALWRWSTPLSNVKEFCRVG